MRSRSAMSSRSSASVSNSVASDGEVVVGLGQVLGLDLVDRDRELRLLAGELRSRIVLRERDRDRPLVAGARADELLLESGHEPARAELDQLISPGAALELLSVDAAHVVHRPRGRRSPRGARRCRAWRGGRAADRSPRRSGPPRPGARDGRPRGPCTRRAWRRDARRSRSRTGAARPSAGSSFGTSSSGSPTGAIPEPSIASAYQLPSALRTASSRTASRPSRRITTGSGTLPLRKPGTRIWRPSSRAACWTRRSTSSGATSAWTRTRDSGSSVTLVLTVLAMCCGARR